MLSDRGLCEGLVTRPEESLCVELGHGPRWAGAPQEKKYCVYFFTVLVLGCAFVTVCTKDCYVPFLSHMNSGPTQSFRFGFSISQLTTFWPISFPLI